MSSYPNNENINFFKNLKDIMANLVVAEQKRVGEFRKQYGSMKIGDVTIDMVFRRKKKNDKHYRTNSVSSLF